MGMSAPIPGSPPDTSWRLSSVPEAPVLFLVSQAPGSTPSRGLRCTLRSHLRVAFWTGGEVAGSDDVPDRDRLDVADRDRTV